MSVLKRYVELAIFILFFPLSVQLIRSKIGFGVCCLFQWRGPLESQVLSLMDYADEPALCNASPRIPFSTRDESSV